jgi:hypothetical protein
MMDWQPIETVPVGVDVMFYCKQCDVPWAKIAVGQKNILARGGQVKVEFLFRVGNQLLRRGTAVPSHWMLMPHAPKIIEVAA